MTETTSLLPGGTPHSAPLVVEVCLWHFNERPLCHLLQKLDGLTFENASFQDPVRKLQPHAKYLEENENILKTGRFDNTDSAVIISSVCKF